MIDAVVMWLIAAGVFVWVLAIWKAVELAVEVLA